MTISKLMHAFIGKDGASNTYNDQSLRMAAGEALVNLTIESPANSLVILEESGYELIKDLTNMLCEDEYKYIAASLLQNICAHAKDKLHHQDTGDYLSSAFPMVSLSIASERNNFGTTLETGSHSRSQADGGRVALSPPKTAKRTLGEHAEATIGGGRRQQLAVDLQQNS